MICAKRKSGHKMVTQAAMNRAEEVKVAKQEQNQLFVNRQWKSNKKNKTSHLVPIYEGMWQLIWEWETVGNINTEHQQPGNSQSGNSRSFELNVHFIRTYSVTQVYINESTVIVIWTIADVNMLITEALMLVYAQIRVQSLQLLDLWSIISNK